ncbi:MAG TPA: glutathione S-transferase [Hyphomicrobiaceae bacterium]|nr:glutathione S-transferase [Hyphomicrobiaceae bacterium]
MKILETRTAPNPRRVRIFLAEKGIEVPFEELDLMQGALRTPEFTEINFFQRVPVLILDDGTAISETVAICRYFEETQPEPALFGKGAAGRATVEMWNRRVELGLLAAVQATFRHLHPAMAHLEVPQVAAWGEANKPKALEILGHLDKQLARHQFIAGDDISIADVTALCAIDFMKPARIQRPPELANIERWHKEMSARPSAKA